MPTPRGVALAALVVQSALLFSNLGLLPWWGDELFTLRAIEQPLPTMFETLRNDIHPPLYYLAQRYWIRLPFGPDRLVRMRALSAIFALGAAAYAMALLLPRLRPAAGVWFCLLLATSPCLLLYGRMARSYSLQLLVSLVAIHQFLRLIERPARLRSAAFGLAAALVLYTHYAPGVAVAAAANLVLLVRNKKLGPLILPNAVMLLAYSPWMVSALTAASLWGRKSDFHRVTGSVLSEEVVKLGYWGLSFLFGESIPWWLFFAEIALSVALVWLAWHGARRAREWRGFLAVLAIVGYLGVSRWVSYPFIPARMLFVLPFAYLLLAHGAEAWPKAGRIILLATVAASALGLWSYFRVENFLNWGYAVPYRQIARDIAFGPAPTIVAAGVFTDTGVLRYYLPENAPFRSIEPPASAERAAEDLASGPWRRVCAVRNTHDTSPDNFSARFEAALARQFPTHRVRYYRPRTRLDRILIAALGWPDTVPYFYEMVEFER